jgi:hypothetical protein
MPSVKDPKIRPYRYRFLWETVGDAINMSPFPRPTHHEERVENRCASSYKYLLLPTSNASCLVLDLSRSVFCLVLRISSRLTISILQDKHYRYSLRAGYITKRESKLADPLL